MNTVNFKSPLFAAVIVLVCSSTDGETECHRRHGGTCINMHYNRCLSGSYYTLTGCSPQEMCCIPAVPHVHTGTFAPGQCGVRMPDPMPASHRIVGGARAAPGEFPWQVLLEYNSNGKYSLQCGGILLDNRWVLTAAHCFESNHNPFSWRAIFGEFDRGNVDGREQLMKVETLIVHSRFQKNGLGNDIAMVKLAEDVNINEKYIRSVCLPSSTDSFSGQMCTVSGFGALQNGGAGSRFLYKADLPILSNDVCTYLLDRPIPVGEICAGHKHGGADACQGDSGGPLVCRDNTSGLWKVAGIVSWGYKCAQAYTPGVYTNVTHYLSWIQSIQQYY